MYGATADQMLFLSTLLDVMKKDEECFRLLSKYGTFFYVMDDDQCLSFEWSFGRMIIAFDIEVETINSCWTLSSTREAGNYHIGGYFHNDGINKVVDRIYSILKEQKDNLEREVRDGKENEK